MMQVLSTVVSPQWYAHAALEEQILTKEDYDGFVESKNSGLRRGVYVGGTRTFDLISRTKFANAVFSALQDRGVIGTYACRILNSQQQCLCASSVVCAGMSFELMMKRMLGKEFGPATGCHYRLLLALSGNAALFVRLGGVLAWVQKVYQVITRCCNCGLLSAC